MTKKRSVEIFSAGCSVCEAVVARVSEIACSSCAVSVLDMRKPEVTERAMSLGIVSVPAVVIDGKLANCCSGRDLDEATLRAEGIGQPLV